MKIRCITVGKKHDADLASAIASYEKRLKPYADFGFEYIAPSTSLAESEAIMRRLKPEDMILLLDESGAQLTNRQLADKLETLQNQGVKRMVIIIGGAYGVADDVRHRCDMVLSLSKLVFPHQLVRLILVEQLYRTYNLLAGGKYHHD